MHGPAGGLEGRKAKRKPRVEAEGPLRGPLIRRRPTELYGRKGARGRRLGPGLPLHALGTVMSPSSVLRIQ